MPYYALRVAGNFEQEKGALAAERVWLLEELHRAREVGGFVFEKRKYYHSTAIGAWKRGTGGAWNEVLL